jgi:hypothetical protein
MFVTSLSRTVQFIPQILRNQLHSNSETLPKQTTTLQGDTHQMQNRFHIIAILAALAVLQGCSYTRQPGALEQGSEVGGTGDIGYTHEKLGANKNLVTVTAAPGVMETEGSIAQRIHIFANRFAAKTCPTAFEFVHDPNFNQSIAGGFMKRTKTYVFICKA